MNKSKIIKTAREWIGTPYHHQGRVKGVGCDCIGLIIGVAHELGLSSYNINGYSPYPDGTKLLQLFRSECLEVDNYEPGDILIFRIKKSPQHCGILAVNDWKLTIIHAYQTTEAVREHEFSPWWRERVVTAFEFPNIVRRRYYKCLQKNG